MRFLPTSKFDHLFPHISACRPYFFLILPDGVISPHPVVSQAEATAARRTRCCWPRRAFLRPALPRCDHRSGGGGVRGCCWFAPQRPKLALGVGVAASFQFRFGLGWFRRAIALSGERGVGPDPFFLSGWGHLPPFNKRALRCLCLNRTPLPPPPTHFIGSGEGVHTEESPPSFPSPISPVGVGAAVRQRSAARKTTIWCAAHPPLLPHLFPQPWQLLVAVELGCVFALWVKMMITLHHPPFEFPAPSTTQGACKGQ